MESDRGSILEKSYMKTFVLAIIFLVVGVILICARTLYINYADPSTPGEVETFYDTLYTLSAFSGLLLQLGMIIFSLSAFWGGMVDRTLSGEVRRGLVFAASMVIIALAIVIVFQTLFIY
ncbi:MAG: hypothetical protein ACFE94_08365 [Candidatus Hodarchaeota archaeon]